jgi:uncharacterized membrane protein YebE (DUF533 family)
LKKFLVSIIIVCVASVSLAQQENTVQKKSGPRRQLATILFFGLGGAILGLSTLSFYGQPQNNLGNIGIGFAVGVIAGTVYVTYKSATSHDYYDDSSKQSSLAPEEPKGFQWAPLITQVKSDDTALGGQFALRF